MSKNQPRKNEVSMKAWVIQRAEELHISPSNVVMKMYRGIIPYPKVRRVNARVIFVILPVVTAETVKAFDSNKSPKLERAGLVASPLRLPTPPAK